MSVPPFMSREKFEKWKAEGGKSGPLFLNSPNYDFCKHVWENSPLFAYLWDEMDKAFPEPKQK